ncbi:MAG: phytanoyl-CoA dioxygenase family protein [Caldilineaceae bacterium]|nr:phytanoyl-CoA dioxygenase family protein [Caldilineaceae bacterium]HRJ42299.1 phytanoyl-CoA dioxygenase family protein [Caldilineaceae bacterium]
MSVTAERIYDYGESATYEPELYHYDSVATEGVDGFENVDGAALAQFDRDGYLVVHNAFTPAEVQGSLQGLLRLISGEVEGFNGVMYEHAATKISVEDMTPEQRQDYVRKFMWFEKYDDRLHRMAHHPKFLAALERLIGETPYLFQDMALLKPPHIGREKPWHQDHAYFELSLNTRVVGAWIALDEATTENGCMIVIPGTHRQGPVVHFKRRDWQICDTHINNRGAVAVPLKPGGCLLFSSLIHHGTPTNHSGLRRRAVQFHYRPLSAPKTSVEERLAIFGEEGKDVTC